MDKVIVWTNENGAVSVCYPTGDLSVEQVLKKDCPPEGVIINSSDLPENLGLFFEAWELNNDVVTVNLNKAKQIGHGFRREMRAKEFAPFDKVIAAQIPGADAAEAEASRQAIREKYAVIQNGIDAAATPDEIKAALGI